jgi:hypothetical protein
MTICEWHRPGRKHRGFWLCRNCGVLIDECPCVPVYANKVADDCPLCLGSAWVAIVRGRYARFHEIIESNIGREKTDKWQRTQQT